MRIIQVATLISPHGAYGGPVRVAVNQTRELIAAGHEVILAAGAQGYQGRLPDKFDGVPVKLFEAYKAVPKLGFSGLVAPGLLNWLTTAMESADVAHIHLGRDLVTLPAAIRIKRSGLPYVLQTHGMVQPSGHPLAGMVDSIWTKPALTGAGRIFFLTQVERLGLAELTGASPTLEELPNGVPQSGASVAPPHDVRPEVLFLARLHERKRPLMFIAMAKALHVKYPKVLFSLVGPDEGMGPSVTAAIRDAQMGDKLVWEGAIDPEKAGDRINNSTIFVLPSIDEPFPMSVLEALSYGKPVVITDSCGLAPTIALHGAGTVVDSSLGSLSKAVEDYLANSGARIAVGKRARILSEEVFSMKRVGKQLEAAYAAISSDS